MQTIEQTSTFLHNSLPYSANKEQDIINIILSNSSKTRQSILKHYSSTFHSSLPKDLSSIFSSPFKNVVTHLFSSPSEYDSFQLKQALKGFTTDDECVYEIICNRPFWHLQLIKQKFNEMYHKDLETEIQRVFSGHIGRNLVILLNTERSNNKQPNHKKCENDAMTLINVNKEESWGSNEDIFKNIFATSSPEELLLTIRYYYKKTKCNLVKAVDTKMSSRMKIFFKEMLYNIVNPAEMFAIKIRKAIRGLGTDTNLLERVIITRNEIDMKKIREYYKEMYNTEMIKDIEGDTSGYYRTLLIGLAEK